MFIETFVTQHGWGLIDKVQNAARTERDTLAILFLNTRLPESLVTSIIPSLGKTHDEGCVVYLSDDNNDEVTIQVDTEMLAQSAFLQEHLPEFCERFAYF